jgi:Tol biopolymer transport system component
VKGSRAAILTVAVLAATLLASAHGVQADVIERVSVPSDGIEALGDSTGPSISADGRYVAFASDAAELVYGDTNVSRDVFVHDRLAGTTQRVSEGTDGAQGYGDSDCPSISADGRYVAFHSDAAGLVEGDTNGVTDVFVHDRLTGVTERVSVGTGGSEATGGSSVSASISSDGRYVAFMSSAADLVDGDTNQAWDVFVHDRQTGTTERVSVATDGGRTGGEQGNGVSRDPSISGDGRYVAFASAATALVDGDTNGVWDVFVHDRQTGATERVSVATGGGDGEVAGGAQATGGDSVYPRISLNGLCVVFTSAATDLVAGDSNRSWDVFIHNLDTGITESVSVGTDGIQGDGNSFDASVSADSRYVAFQSVAANLVYDDTQAITDTFVRDLEEGTTSRVNVNSSGNQAGESAVSGCSISPSPGAVLPFVAFASSADNLVTDDTNKTADVFVVELGAAADDVLGPIGENGEYVDEYIDASVPVTRCEETYAGLEYTGAWRAGGDSRFSGGAQKYSWDRVASVTITFEGTNLEWIGKTSPLMGIASVTVDGGAPVSVDLYTAATLFAQKVWTTGELSEGVHVLTIACTGTRNELSRGTAINFDAAEVIAGSLLTAP